MVEVVFRSEEDRQRFINDQMIPDYLSDETKQTIQSRQWDVFEEFISPRRCKQARKELRYPVWLCVLEVNRARLQ
jgi:hypothetical protein